jgi:hypothetical protein
MTHRLRGSTGAVVATVLALLVTPQLAGAQDDLPLNIRANAINAAPGGRATMLQITINRWTTDAEGESIYNAIKTGKQVEIEKAMQSLESVGKANMAGRMGLDLRVARQYKMQDGSSQIILATDRPISIAEETRGGKSTDYNTSLIILDLPASGEGKGAMYGAVMLSVGESGKIEPETAGQGATALGSVKVVEKKKKK